MKSGYDCSLPSDRPMVILLFQVPRREVHRAYDRIYATLYGHCIGDAIGLLTEGLTRADVKKVYIIYIAQKNIFINWICNITRRGAAMVTVVMDNFINHSLCYMNM